MTHEGPAQVTAAAKESNLLSLCAGHHLSTTRRRMTDARVRRRDRKDRPELRLLTRNAE